MQLNFTHRTAHGAGEDSDAKVGKFAKLADEQLARLKRDFPSVFVEPTYPVDRSDCPH